MRLCRAFLHRACVSGGVLAVSVAGLVTVDARAQETTVARSTIALGAAAVIKPKYEGSNEHEVIPIPIVIPKFADRPDEAPSAYSNVRKRVNFRGLDDIRVRVFGGDRFQVGAVTGYITKRDEDDGDLLRGLGDIDGGLVLGAYSAFRVGAFTFDAALLDKLTGDEAGLQYRFGVETTRQVTERLRIGVRVGTTVASQDYMQTYFGVTPTQSFKSKAGLPVYTPDAGVKDVFVSGGASLDLSERWLLKAGARYGRLVDEAADSPVVQTANQVSGTVGLAYRFNWYR